MTHLAIRTPQGEYSLYFIMGRWCLHLTYEDNRAHDSVMLEKSADRAWRTYMRNARGLLYETIRPVELGKPR